VYLACSGTNSGGVFIVAYHSETGAWRKLRHLRQVVAHSRRGVVAFSEICLLSAAASRFSLAARFFRSGRV
jgi:hypothetical protein